MSINSEHKSITHPNKFLIVSNQMNGWLAQSEDVELTNLHLLSQKVGVERALIEFSARLCYNSLPKIGSAPMFVENVLERGHLSVAEHPAFLIKIPTKMKYRAPSFGYSEMRELTLKTRYINVKQNQIFANLRALEEATYGSNLYTKAVLNSILHPIFPTLYEKGDLEYEDISQKGMWVPRSENVVLLSTNFGNLTRFKFSREFIRDVYKWSRYTFLIDNVSRAFSHQFVRHRGMSISQESQRYVDAKNNRGFVEPKDITEEQERVLYESYLNSMASYEKLRELGMKKEDARLVLPSGIMTRLVASVEYRELLHFLRLRTEKHAQWEIRHVAKQMLEQAFLVTPTLKTKELGELYESVKKE